MTEPLVFLDIRVRLMSDPPSTTFVLRIVCWAASGLAQTRCTKQHSPTVSAIVQISLQHKLYI
jgi:hypothetical protein